MSPGHLPSRYGASPGTPATIRPSRITPQPWSRRRLLGSAGAASTLVIASGLRGPRSAAAEADATPKPVPGGIDPFNQGFLFHVYDFGQEPSTITDFRGTIGIARVAGEGTITKGTAGLAAGTPVPTGGRLVFDVDMRFMQGTYRGEDGQLHDGTYSLV
jgi:hypothetical protein